MILAVVVQVRLHLLGQQTSIVQVLQHLEQAPNFLRRNLILLAGSCLLLLVSLLLCLGLL